VPVDRALALVLLVLAVIVVAGCAAPMRPRPGSVPSGATGRLLVIARHPGPENRGIATRAGELFAHGLRPIGEVWSADDLVREAAASANPAWALRLVERLSVGGWPTADDRIELLRFGLTGLVTIEVTEYDQVWGKFAKFTRASVEAQAFDVASGSLMWRVHRSSEVEDLRGRAFERALEVAINDLLSSIQPGGGRVSAVELWRWWRR
jgi:hypothetical protein